MVFTEIFDLVDSFLEITLAFFTRVRKLLGFGKIGVWRNNNEIFRATKEAFILTMNSSANSIYLEPLNKFSRLHCRGLSCPRRSSATGTGSVALPPEFGDCNVFVSVSVELSEQIRIPKFPWGSNAKWSLLIIQIQTAGRAKNEIANTEKHEATILPVQVLGTVSP